LVTAFINNYSSFDSLGKEAEYDKSITSYTYLLLDATIQDDTLILLLILS